MFVISNLLHSIATVLDVLLNLYVWVLIARAILSWVSPDPYNPIVRFLSAVTDPLMYKVRRLLPFPLNFGGIDFTPMALILVIMFLRSFLVPTLHQLAYRLG